MSDKVITQYKSITLVSVSRSDMPPLSYINPVIYSFQMSIAVKLVYGSSSYWNSAMSGLISNGNHSYASDCTCSWTVP